MLEASMLFILFLVLLLHLTQPCHTTANYVDQIVTHLFQNYNVISPPNVPVHVYLKLTINNLVEVNEREETIKIIEWRSMYWTDQRLAWNPTDYGNVSWISIPNHLIWKPDLRLHDVIDRAELVQAIDVLNSRVSHEGRIRYAQPEISTVRCRLSFRLFPFDTQKCHLQYESWSYESEELILNISGMDLLLDTEATFHEWSIIDTNVERKQIEYPIESRSIVSHYDNIIFHITFKRSPIYYLYVIILPTLIITLVNVIGAFTPFNPSGERQEKVNLGLTTLLTMTVMLQLITDSVPKSSSGLPLLGTFIFLQLTISTAATVTSIIIMFINHRALANNWNVPRCLLLFLCLHKENKHVKCNLSRKHHRKSTFPTDDNKEESSDFVAALRKVEVRVKDIRDMIEGKISENHRGKLWNLVLDRVDVYLLVVFLTLNFAAVCYLLTPVYQSLYSII